MCLPPMTRFLSWVAGIPRRSIWPTWPTCATRAWVKSLKAALLALPAVTVHEQCAVTGFVLDGGNVVGVDTAQGPILGDQVVLAAGAWSGELLGTLGLGLPVEPVKGQMILYKCASDFLSSMVLAKGRYAIPRRDGHILIGSTLEHEGFDKTPTDTALESLKASAVELIPALADAEVVGHWAGLRPGSPEGIPFIGRVPGFNGLWLNCGHYRNGLVLAPASCQLFVDLLLERAPIIDPATLSPPKVGSTLDRLRSLLQMRLGAIPLLARTQGAILWQVHAAVCTTHH